MTHRLSLDRIAAAMHRIDPVFLHTPCYRAEALEAELGCRLVIKVETCNPIRSFKGRGASLFVQALPDATPLVCASAGNFGQAIAYAGRARGIPVTVFASEQANPLKLARMRALGATVRLAGADFDTAKAVAREAAARDGARFVEDGDEPAIAEGAGTIGVELLTDWSAASGTGTRAPDAVVLPLGNGALATGVGRWVKATAPAVAMVAVASAGAPSMVESFRSGTVVAHATMDTIADGIGVRIPVPSALADMQGTVDRAVLVREGSIVRAMQLLHRHTGLVVEPAGAVGVAAVLEDPGAYRDATVATVLCGSNLAPAQMQQWLAPADAA